VNALGAILTVFFCGSILVLPRRQAALAIMASTLYLTQGQAVEIGFNLFSTRFIEMAAFARILMRGELRRISFVPVDRLLLIFFSVMVGIYTIRSGYIDAYQFGTAVDGWLCYFSLRALIVDLDDFTFLMKGTALLLVPFALLMTLEATTGHNLFVFMGGIQDTPEFRNGHYRAQGSFRHAILAGSLGATTLAILIGFLFQRSCRQWAVVGIVASVVIVLASHSSGPFMAAGVSVVAWGFWRFRLKMKLVRRSIFFGMLAMHLAMKAPIWFIFARISDVLGGDGWHRSNLIDKFITNFGNWWFAGMDFLDTADWAATKLSTGGVDTTNYYVSIGIVGGLLSLVLFIAVFVACFKLIGRALGRLRIHFGASNPTNEAILWGVGCAVCSHMINLTAVEYFDQFYVIWYLHLAVLVSLSTYALAKFPAKMIGADEGVGEPVESDDRVPAT
jgi:hypothetical protein